MHYAKIVKCQGKVEHLFIYLFILQSNSKCGTLCGGGEYTIL